MNASLTVVSMDNTSDTQLNLGTESILSPV